MSASNREKVLNDDFERILENGKPIFMFFAYCKSKCTPVFTTLSYLKHRCLDSEQKQRVSRYLYDAVSRTFLPSDNSNEPLTARFLDEMYFRLMENYSKIFEPFSDDVELGSYENALSRGINLICFLEEIKWKNNVDCDKIMQKVAEVWLRDRIVELGQTAFWTRYTRKCSDFDIHPVLDALKKDYVLLYSN
ncbi:hypothetical protein MHBO_000935 [Bonamia ostreae]|uniref:Sesquiterpene synthase n=1 Tax=Bonamia ostreae TaxID=126728 RepID=A0ABV2AHC3_9EUKA